MSRTRLNFCILMRGETYFPCARSQTGKKATREHEEAPQKKRPAGVAAVLGCTSAAACRNSRADERGHTSGPARKCDISSRLSRNLALRVYLPPSSSRRALHRKDPRCFSTFLSLSLSLSRRLPPVPGSVPVLADVTQLAERRSI